MSRWAEGILDSDTASDGFIIIVREIIATIQKCLDDEAYQPLSAGLRGETFLMPGVDILLTLTKTYPDIMIPIMTEEPISEWRKWYLKVFDEEHVEYKDDKSTIDHRVIIVETFAELETLSRSFD